MLWSCGLGAGAADSGPVTRLACVSLGLGGSCRGFLPRVQAHDQPAQDSTLEMTRTRRGWKARETPEQMHSMAIVSFWDFHVKNCSQLGGPLRTA